MNSTDQQEIKLFFKKRDARLQKELLSLPELPPFQEKWLEPGDTKEAGKLLLPVTDSLLTLKRSLAYAAAAVLTLAPLGYIFFSGGATQPEIASALRVTKGNIQFMPTSSKTRNTIQAGETIQVMKGDAELKLANRHTILLKENSQVRLSKLKDLSSGNSEFQMTLVQGSLTAQVERLQERESFQIKTELALVIVRGTGFLVEESPEGTRVAVTQGQVLCKALNGSGKERLMGPGDVWKIRKPSTPPPAQVIKTEADLKRVYKRLLEIITLDDGRVIRGVTLSKKSGRIRIRTLKGIVIIDEKKITGLKME